MSTVGGAPTTRGGSDTSLENNNVYGLEPKVYVEGSTAAPGACRGLPGGAGGCRRAAGGCCGAHCGGMPREEGCRLSAACLPATAPDGARACAPRPPAETASESGEGVANAATAAITVLAVVGVVVAGGATAFYFFGP